MDEDTKMVAAGAAIGVVCILSLAYIVMRSRRDGQLQPGQTPITAITGNPNPCRAIMQWSWHLRPSEQTGHTGSTEYPAGTEVVILQAGNLTRNGARIYRIRVARDNREGWGFVLPQELIGDCRGASPEEVARRASEAASASSTGAVQGTPQALVVRT